jgi:hypothetical protein
MAGQYHERLQSTEKKKRSSERSFGLIVGGALLVIAAYLAWRGRGTAPYLAAPGAIIMGLALIRPHLLAPLNWIWSQFGMLLHRVTSPIIISTLFFLVITPVGLLMRICGQRPLKLDFDKSAESYWVKRTPPGPAPGTLKRQF